MQPQVTMITQIVQALSDRGMYSVDPLLMPEEEAFMRHSLEHGIQHADADWVRCFLMCISKATIGLTEKP